MEKSAELKKLLLEFYDASTKGNFSYIEELFSQRDGVLSIGTDPNEWWADHATISRVWGAILKEVGVMPIEADDPQAYSEGTVGWVADRPKFKMPDGTEVPVRVTAVFHKENGEWKCVQMHGSFGVLNEDTFFGELPQ